MPCRQHHSELDPADAGDDRAVVFCCCWPIFDVAVAAAAAAAAAEKKIDEEIDLSSKLFVSMLDWAYLFCKNLPNENELMSNSENRFKILLLFLNYIAAWRKFSNSFKIDEGRGNLLLPKFYLIKKFNNFLNFFLEKNGLKK